MSRERPAWADRARTGDRVVACGGCGKLVRWERFHEHLRDCDGRGREREAAA